MRAKLDNNRTRKFCTQGYSKSELPSACCPVPGTEADSGAPALARKGSRDHTEGKERTKRLAFMVESGVPHWKPLGIARMREALASRPLRMGARILY